MSTEQRERDRNDREEDADDEELEGKRHEDKRSACWWGGIAGRVALRRAYA